MCVPGSSKHRRQLCACAWIPPTSEELDLNSGAERGDREGEEEKERKEVNGSGTDEKKNKQATCLDKAKKEKRLWLPLWCDVW